MRKSNFNKINVVVFASCVNGAAHKPVRIGVFGVLLPQDNELFRLGGKAAQRFFNLPVSRRGGVLAV